jgi:hypothetical protein
MVVVIKDCTPGRMYWKLKEGKRIELTHDVVYDEAKRNNSNSA